jgi:hypothetical protein
MTKARDGAKAAGRDAPVGLRLGDLERHVQARQHDETAAGAVVKRDLGRFYALLAEITQTFSFSLSEAEALVVALWDFDAAAVRYLWAEVEKQYREQAADPTGRHWYLPTDVDPLALVSKLSQFSVAQNMAILDAVERYWVLVARTYPEQLPLEAMRDADLLVEVGLVSPARMALDVQQRRTAGEKQGEPTKVLDLMDALKASLAGRYRGSSTARGSHSQRVGRHG